MKRSLQFIFTLALLSLFIIPEGQAQQLNMDLLKDMEPRNIGPAGMSGRITSIDVVNSDPNIMYAGAASGGLWKSTSGGIDWEPIFDSYGAHSIGHVEIFQKNPDIIWVGTGEGNPRNSQSSGAGIYKSIDGGRSFELMGLEATRNIHRVIIHPDNPDVVWVGAQGSAWGDTEDRGVYKTTDGGKTWDKVLYVNSRTGIGDMVMDPSNPNKIIAAMWEFRRWPWFFESGGEGSGMFMTLDGGETWNEITSEDGLPEGDLGRMGLAFAPSEPEIVYAHVESKKNAIYRSEDGGFTWEMRQTVENDGEVGNRPFYYADIYVDPFNENRVFSIYTYISVSEDGGKSFESLYPYYNWVHPDHHAFWLSETQKGFMMDGNDGGMNVTYDGGKNWRFIDNIPVGQYYHVNVDMEFPYNVYGGMQDNGSWQGPAYVWRDGGIRNAYWEELFFGDGFDVMMDPSDSRYAYAMSQQGNVGRVDLETGTSRFVRPTHPDGDELRFNWNSAINFDPFDEETIYFGSQYVHKSTDRGESWEIISPDLTTNDTTKQQQSESGGLTLDATGAENFTTILAIEPSPVEQDVIWVGTDDGKVHITRNGGETWTDLTNNIKGVPEGSWVAQVKASTLAKGEAVAVINNYRRNDWGVYVMHTDNYGRSWTNIARNKGLEGYALSYEQDPVSENLMFIGTELGLYVTIDGGDNWTRWTNGYPTASTYDMVIHPREHDLVIGTFGRSFWVLDDIRPLRDLAMNGADELEKAIRVYQPPTAYMVDWRQAAGSRFSADGMYAGDNRPNGARITYSVNSEMLPEAEEGEEKDQEITIEIFDLEGNQIRTLTETPDQNGINRMTWGMEMKGVDRPSRNVRRESDREPGGADVLPGEYKIRMSYGDFADSTIIKVEYDPRIEMSMESLRKTQEFVGGLQDLNVRLKEQTDRLAKAMDIVEMNEEMAAADDRGKDELEDVYSANKEIKDMIEEMQNMIFGTPDDRQGIVRNPEVTVMNRLGAAGRYLGNDYDGPGSKEQRLLELAEESVNDAVLKIQTFFRSDWDRYQSTIENAELSPFKDL